MSLYAESQSTLGFKPVPAGVHLARLYRIIDLGTQESNFEGKINHLHKIKFVWEVHSQDEEGNPLVTDKGDPMIITKDYTLTWGEKANLRKDLEAWRGKPFTPEEQRRFDLKNVLDKWCMINVSHKPRKQGNGVYANVVGITPVPSVVRSSGLPAAFNPSALFTISEPDMDLFESFGEFLKETIMKSPEWKAQVKKGLPDSGFDDMPSDLPF